jgi:hypothetical protein
VLFDPDAFARRRVDDLAAEFARRAIARRVRSMPAMKPRPRTDWRRRFGDTKPPKLVVLESDFAGIRAGSTLFIATPGLIANHVARIPAGEHREMQRLRNELARRHGAHATCPVTTAIYLRVVAEAAWDDLQDGASVDRVVPFWRAIDPASALARKLRCGPDWIRSMRDLEAGSPEVSSTGDAPAK